MYWPFKTKTIASKKNGLITLVRSFGHIRVRVGDTQQSGPELALVWREALRKIEKSVHFPSPHVLMLGLGSGSAIAEICTLFPNARITAVEHDPHMIAIARELGIGVWKTKPTLIEADAHTAVAKLHTSFDLILVDLFTGRLCAPFVADVQFIEDLKQRLAPGGILLINAFLEPHMLRTAETLFTHSVQWPITCNTVGAFWDAPAPVVPVDIL